MKRLLVIGFLFPFLAGLSLTQAQEVPCPATLVCLDYHGTSLQIDPKDGPLQYLVVETTVATTTTFDGQTTSQTIKLQEFVQDGDAYDEGDVRTFERAGVFANADLGDTFGLSELAQ